MNAPVQDDTACLIQDGLRWRRQIAEERARQARAAEDWLYSDSPRALRTLISELPCGKCGFVTIVVHPLPQWAFDALPDTSWVRCGDCPAVPRAV